MMIEIYSKDFCPSCDKAIRMAQAMIQETSKHSDLQVFKLGRDFNREELLAKFPNAKTFPQIIIDGESIGGYDELEARYG